jgi:hypothetical protein
MWQARLKLLDGRQPTRSSAVKKFGNEEAYRRAVAARQQLLELVADKPFLHSPTAWRFEAQNKPLRLTAKSRELRPDTKGTPWRRLEENQKQQHR